MSAPAVKLVVVGTSMGGLHALETLLRGLPADFPVPLAVVQHRGVEADELLVPLLQHHAALPVTEANDKEPLVSGHVYVAPPDYHLLIDGGRLALSTDERVLHARPSIDVLFESAADSYRDGVVGVVLTGASSDGTNGALRIKRCGGQVVAQDPASADAPLMPRSVIAAGVVDRVLPLDEIAPWLNIATQTWR